MRISPVSETVSDRKLRILHVLASPGPGGAEVLTRDLSQALVRRGHQVGIAFISHAEQVGNPPEFERNFLDSLEAGSVESLHIGHPARRNPFYGAWRLAAIVRRFRPDILHIHLQSALLFRLLARTLPTPAFATIYTHHTDHLKLGSRPFALLARATDHLVAISGQTRELLSAHTTRPVTHIPNAVGLPLHPPRPDRSSAEVFRILSVGRLHPPKDYPTLVEAASILFGKRPDLAGKLVFDIVGEGSERAKIEALIGARRLEGKVRLLGLRMDVPDLMRDADLLLMTSSWEGLPITLLEALHARLPIVATNVGACPEVVRDGENGFIAPPGDPQRIAESILRIMDDPALAFRFGERSAERALEYGIDASVDRHLELYRKVSEARAGRAG